MMMRVTSERRRMLEAARRQFNILSKQQFIRDDQPFAEPTDIE